MSHVYNKTERAYRSGCRPRAGEQAFQVVLEESDLWIVTDSPANATALRDRALTVLQQLRGQIKGYIALHPAFGHSYSPVAVSTEAPSIIRRMAEAAQRCDVGPMAAVAGAVAQSVAEALAKEKSAAKITESLPNILVENGGDTYLFSDKERLVGFLPDPEGKSTLALRLPAGAFPVSLCSSSATIGHSASLGQGELVAVRSKSGFFADAAATALCNLLQKPKDLDKVLAQAQKWSTPLPEASYPEDVVEGVFAQCKGQIAVWGDMELAAL